MNTVLGSRVSRRWFGDWKRGRLGEAITGLARCGAMRCRIGWVHPGTVAERAADRRWSCGELLLFGVLARKRKVLPAFDTFEGMN